jgi:tRNA (guanine10-N2)-dimethyltransferase
MKIILHLSKQNIDLAKSEALSLLDTEKYELFDNILIAENKKNMKPEKRLGYSHSVYEFLFKCSKNNLIKTVEKYNWQKIYRKNFCVRINGTTEFREKDIAGYIYRKIKNPKVDLENPKTKIEFFFRKNVVICGLFMSDVDKSFLKRKAHLRPSLHPTSMHPGLARVLINLTGLEKGTILDPFCGSGGILIEAGVMGFKTIGYDIDEEQIQRATKNIRFYKIKNCRLEKKDALTIKIKPDAVVTDFPYGKGSKGKNLEKLYENFLKKAYSKTNNAVVMLPKFISYKKIIQKTGWKIKNKFEIYVHKSLTRIILKLAKTLSH